MGEGGNWNENDISSNKLTTCAGAITTQSPPLKIEDADTEVIWTYDIKWEYSEIRWASRWDLYLKMTDSNIHWFSIMNSIMIVLFLSGMVAMILVRALRKDISKYNASEVDPEDAEEDRGWKLIHGDVFRPPARGACLVFYGTGVQLF